MKDRYLINYELFCQRRKFSLKDFLLKNPSLSYAEIKEFFRKIKTQAPSETHFNDVKMQIEKTSNLESIDLEKDAKTKVEVVKEKEVKKTTRRRRKRKTNVN